MIRQTGYGSYVAPINEPRTTTYSYENTLEKPSYPNMIYWTPDQGYGYNGGGYSSTIDPGQEDRPEPMPEYQYQNDSDYGYTPDPSPSSIPSDYEINDMPSLIDAMRRSGMDVDNIMRQAKTMEFDNGNQDSKSLFDRLKQYYIQYRNAITNGREKRRAQMRDYIAQKKVNRQNN